jgi:hypothetical protein
MAAARPMPRDAPVTNAMRLLSDVICLLFRWLNVHHYAPVQSGIRR